MEKCTLHLFSMSTTIPSSKLKIGMYVSDLDRPWLDTPFLLQGLLIENDEQIGQLQKYCKFVLIDWDRSAQELQAAKPASDSNAKLERLNSIAPSISLNHTLGSTCHTSIVDNSAPESIKKKLADVQAPVDLKTKNASSETNIKVGLLGSLFAKTKKLLKIKNNSKDEYDTRKDTVSSDLNPAITELHLTDVKRPAFVPDNVELTIYNNARPVEEEFAPADKAYTLTEKVLHGLVQDLHSDKNLDIAEVEIVIQEVVGSMVRNPNALMLIMQLRQQDTISYGYGLQTAVYLIALGRHIGLPKDFLERLGITGLLLDIGNIKLPSELLQKDDQLTLDEFEIIKSHVRLGLEILKETPDLHNDILEGIAQHHERENGSGYPAGISKGDICLFGRMAAIVNSFTALTNTCIHSKAVSAYDALKSISTKSGEYYLDSMVEQFIQTIGIFPVGSLVELSSGEVAVVISQSKVRRLKPRVLIISDSNKSPVPHPATLDLLCQPEMTAAIHILRGLPTGAYDLAVREYYLA